LTSDRVGAPVPTGAGVTGRQLALVEAFGDRPDLTRYYLGARRVLQDETNPDRLAQAAHSVRELLEKLPNYFDVPAEKGDRSLKAEAKNLAVVWDRTVKNSRCYDSERWSGEIDGSLHKFLRKAMEFFKWLGDERPARVDQAREFLRATDASPYRMPVAIERLRLAEWDEYRNFFVGIAHHGTATFDDVEQWLASLEDFLLRQLVPRTFEDRDEIRRIVAEAERDAHP